MSLQLVNLNPKPLAMTFFPKRTRSDLQAIYGYYNGIDRVDLDRNQNDLKQIESQGYRRELELYELKRKKQDQRNPNVMPKATRQLCLIYQHS